MTYDVAELAHVSKKSFEEISGLEYYARYADERGAMTFLAITGDGERIGLVYYRDGDAMEDGDYRDSVTR